MLTSKLWFLLFYVWHNWPNGTCLLLMLLYLFFLQYFFSTFSFLYDILIHNSVVLCLPAQSAWFLVLVNSTIYDQMAQTSFFIIINLFLGGRGICLALLFRPFSLPKSSKKLTLKILCLVFFFSRIACLCILHQNKQ